MCIRDRNGKLIEEKYLENGDKIQIGKYAVSYTHLDVYKRQLKFIKQIGTNPPFFLVFSNMDISSKTNIKNYIEKTLRENYEFNGTPVMLKFKY